MVRLARTITVARILERDDFAKRMAAQEPISVSELLYPLMQAYDSVAIEADVELGGTDQLYNLLAGRDVMEAYGLEPQVVLTTPLLLSWDGEKMSSSVGNNIPLTAAPEEQFGRTMRISDDQLEDWYRLVLEEPAPTGDPLEAKLGWRGSSSPARTGRRRPRAAEAHFTRVVREGKAPEDVPEAPLPARRSRPSARRARRRLRTLDQRGAPADRPGRRPGERRGRHRTRLAPLRGRKRARSGRQASLHPLDTPLTLAIIPRLPEKAAWKRPDDQEFQTKRSETEVEGSEVVGLRW